MALGKDLQNVIFSKLFSHFNDIEVMTLEGSVINIMSHKNQKLSVTKVYWKIDLLQNLAY